LKILTLNTHSLHGENCFMNCHILCKKIAEELPDIIALQEVNQYMNDKTAPKIERHIAIGEVPIKESNFALYIQKILTAMHLDYRFCWLGMKKGYDRFDEGLAVFSKAPVKETRSLLLTNTKDYNNFKKRMALLTETEDGIFINCHLGWEGDLEEPFEGQLRRINACYNFKKPMYLLGDFNVSPQSEGYKKITDMGWNDTFILAEVKKGEATISGKIDGWEENSGKLRIDYIFANKIVSVKKSEVLFDGEDAPQISDHFGVMITV